jgi:hypothetical protein
MSTQVAMGTLCMSDQTEIPLGPTTVTDGSDTQEVLSDPAFTIVAQSIGDYAPGKTITGAIVTSKTHIGFAYIQRQGLVGVTIPVASRTAGGSGGNPLPICKPWVLQPGDKILIHTEA